jgi:hypothetical protein
VNSVVAKWLGFKEAAYTGRYAIRGCAELESNHNFEPLFMQFSGKGFRAGVVPCDEKTVYWFFTWTPTIQGKFLFLSISKVNSLFHSKMVLFVAYIKSYVRWKLLLPLY